MFLFRSIFILFPLRPSKNHTPPLQTLAPPNLIKLFNIAGYPSFMTVITTRPNPPQHSLDPYEDVALDADEKYL